MLSAQDKAMRVKQVYSELDRKFEEEETQRIAQQIKIPYMNLYGFPIDMQALTMLSQGQAEAFGAAVFFKEGHNVKVGTVNPREAVAPLLKQLEAAHYQPEVYLVSHSSLKHMLDGYGTVLKTDRHEQKMEIRAASLTGAGSLKDLAARLSRSSVTEMVEAVMSGALALDASDVHIEPEGKDAKIRYRLDGVLQDITAITSDMYHQILSRIKITAKLKLNITVKPQDGSFSLTFNGIHVDVRVSVLPSAYGESIVMRLLRQDKGALKFEELGIMGLAQERILHEMNKPNGMILTTGPTGSGKTTTLYAILSKLNEPGVKIITLEDPVEYRIEGITQTPIDANAGFKFADGLRAILRQDPDIVMVGEMRDLETAETASQAALTGHIVLSTLHTNDAPSAIPRLLDMGIRPFVLAPAINAIIGQRLVRKICPACKESYELPAALLKRVEMVLKVVPKTAQAQIPTKLEFFHSPGCQKCNGLGYKGRLGVYEVFTISDAIEKMIIQGATTGEIKRQAIEEGMLTMAQDGILKALQGLTDIEEVFRVTEE